MSHCKLLSTFIYGRSVHFIHCSIIVSNIATILMLLINDSSTSLKLLFCWQSSISEIIIYWSASLWNVSYFPTKVDRGTQINAVITSKD